MSVNGEVAHVGQRVGAADRVRVDGREVAAETREEAPLRVLMYNKPAGEICTRKDDEGRPTVFDALPALRQGRWLSVGRLDFNTSGLMLFSNSGELVHRLMHPAEAIEREYAVRVLGEPDDEVLATLRAGVMLDDRPARFTHVSDRGGDGVNHWYHVVLEEGRNREVHRLWESQGLRVSRLTRVRYGDLLLPRDLRAGRWAELQGDLLKVLLDRVGLAHLMPVERVRAGQRTPRGAPRRPRAPGAEVKRPTGGRPPRDRDR